MCWQIALGIASTAANTVVQAEQSRRQNEAYQANALNANQNATEQYYQNNMQRIQEEAKAVQQRMENKEGVLKAKGTALASTENSGQSTSQVLRDVFYDTAFFTEVIKCSECHICFTFVM